MVRVAVMGSGSWGTAVGKVLADAGNDVIMWARRKEIASEIDEQHSNRTYLPDTELPATMRATTDPGYALAGAEEIVLAVPSQSLADNLAGWVDLLPAEAGYVSLAKGIEQGTLRRASEIIAEVGRIDPARIGVLSGPNLAKEIADEQYSATVLACADAERATHLQQIFATGYLRPYTNTDVVGCEIAGAAKNVIALICGMAAGMGLGYNTNAALITRGLAEITRLGIQLGAEQQTFAGLAGLGDLVATCTSSLSRNRRFGEQLGQGRTMDQAQAATNGQVAEGVKSCTSIRALARRAGVEMPLTEAAHLVCHSGVPVATIVKSLMDRSKKSE